jgi:hypothetical protein
MVIFDATMLMLLIRPDAGRPIDSSTGEPINYVGERIAYFVEQQEKTKTRIGLPTPALSEVLVRAGDSAVQILEKIKEFSVFEILPFDELCAIEVALMTKKGLDSGDKKAGSVEIWNKIKYDRQIVAIARVRQASAIYTDDAGLGNTATRVGLPVVGLAGLQLPPGKAQGELPLNPPTEISDDATLEEIEKARNAEPEQSNPI